MTTKGEQRLVEMTLGTLKRQMRLAFKCTMNSGLPWKLGAIWYMPRCRRQDQVPFHSEGTTDSLKSKAMHDTALYEGCGPQHRALPSQQWSKRRLFRGKHRMGLPRKGQVKPTPIPAPTVKSVLRNQSSPERLNRMRSRTHGRID